MTPTPASKRDGARSSTLPDRLRRAIADLELAGRSILVACSGGPDSTALVIALAELREDLALSLQVATLDHGLRQGSARDALYVERLCRALRLPCERRKLDLGTVFPDGIEAAARAARYAALDEIARAREADVIATGHTLEDQVETVLMRLAGGAGLAGARGIQRRRGRIVRPLLDVTRREVDEFLRARRVRARVDPTNASLDFTRNRVRHQILPTFDQALGASALKAIARFALIADRDERCLQAIAEQAGAAICAPRFGAGPGVEGEVAALRGLDPALRFRVLRDAASSLGASLDFDTFERLERALATQAPTRVSMPRGVEFRVRYGRFALERPRQAPRRADPPATPLFIDGPMVGSFQGWRVSAAPLAPFSEPRPGAVAIEARADGLRWPLQVRTRAGGDVFAPAAGAGHKKLKAWLIDAKIPRERRDALVLLTDSAGEVLWIVGKRESRWTTRRVGQGGGLEVSIERASPEEDTRRVGDNRD